MSHLIEPRADSGWYYKPTLPGLAQQASIQRLRKVTDDYEQEGQDKGDTRLNDSDAETMTLGTSRRENGLSTPPTTVMSSTSSHRPLASVAPVVEAPSSPVLIGKGLYECVLWTIFHVTSALNDA